MFFSRQVYRLGRLTVTESSSRPSFNCKKETDVGYIIATSERQLDYIFLVSLAKSWWWD